jgi:hypothetical protein
MWTEGKFSVNQTPILHPKYYTRTPYTNKQLRDIFRQYTMPKVLYLEVGTMPGFGGRTLQVMNRQPDISKYRTREQNEENIFNYVVSIKFGFDIDSKNSLYVAAVTTQQGFSALEHQVNWPDGLSTDAESHRNALKYYGFETGYSFCPFKQNSAFSSDLGIHFLFVSGDPGTTKFSWGPHLSMGPKFRIGDQTDMRIMPTGYFNVKRLETGTQTMELATRLYTIGLKIAVRKYF